MTEPVRLAKRVAEQKGCSRSEAERYIEGGWVSVNGQVIEVPAFKVAPQQAVVIDPHATLLDSVPVTLLLHKPPGYEAALDNGPGPQGSRSRGAPPALQLLTAQAHAPDDRSGIRLLRKHLAGLTALLALPTEASGLTVFTQDWRVERKLTEDADEVEQEIMAQVRGEVAPAQLQRLSHGLTFNGRPLPPARVSVSSSNEQQTRLRFALKGIRPGQIPSMCDSVGLQLLTLRRIRIGRVAMAGLAPGQWRYLLPHERF
ncbi:MAG: RNA-binding protein [Ramlibacter sp.]|nr:RNA-binding protein [Ramlibacter sp.]